MARTGKLIVLEGPDGVGKTTMAKWICDENARRYIDTVYLASPGRLVGTLGLHVYDLHHDPKAHGITEIDPVALQVLHVAAHIDMVNKLVRPTLAIGANVVLDRCWWSLRAYGAVYGLPWNVIKHMVDLELSVWGEIQPDLLIVLDRREPINRDHQLGDHAALSAMYELLVKTYRPYGYAHLVSNEDFDAAHEQVGRLLAEIYGSW